MNHHIYRVIVPDQHHEQVLLEYLDDVWQLPGWASTEAVFWQSTSHINAMILERYGLVVTTLRCIELLYTAEQHIRVYEAETHAQRRPLPPTLRWVHPAQATALAIPAATQTLLRQWDSEQSRRPEIRRAWACPGWWNTVEPWIDNALETFGQQRTAPAIQLRTWERSCVWEISTSTGRVFFKAQPQIFQHEPLLHHWLEQTLPGTVPALLTWDQERVWTLTADGGTRTLDHVEDQRIWVAAVRTFARIQLESASQNQVLEQLGVPVYGLEQLKRGIDDLLHNLDGYPGLRREQRDILRSKQAGWQAIIDQLAAINLPLALDHGDLWPSNILVPHTNPLFFDWSDSSLTHPFTGMSIFIDYAAMHAFEHDPSLQTQLRTAYLALWSEAYPGYAITQAYHLAQQLAPLHYAVMYHQRILPALEARWEMVYMLPFYISLLLKEG